MHDLEELRLLCVEPTSSVGVNALKLEDLTGYAVELRYDPEFWPSQKTAAEAVVFLNELAQ